MAKQKTREKVRDVQHQVSITVTEHETHRMILRKELARGKTKDGRAIEVSQSTASIVIQVGTWGTADGRQFSIGITDLVAGVLVSMGVE